MKTKILFALLFLTVGLFANAQLILPVTGVSTDEAASIAAFITMANSFASPVDQSANTAIKPTGSLWGIGTAGRNQVTNLIKQYNSNSAIGINVVPYGLGKLANIRYFDNNGALTKAIDIQYRDPFEFWVKLQSPPPAYRRGDNDKIIWVIYRQGVNRAEAEEMVGLL